MEKVLGCGDRTVGCLYVVRGATKGEVLQRAAKHAAEAHSITEVTPNLAVKARRDSSVSMPFVVLW